MKPMMENTSWMSLTIEINPCIPKSVPVEVMMDEKRYGSERRGWEGRGDGLGRGEETNRVNEDSNRRTYEIRFQMFVNMDKAHLTLTNPTGRK